jgi:peptidoglycan L-alanyl-D-glutamate endopeptidase CwlK
MNKYSKKSNELLNQCNQDIIIIFNEVIKYFDNSIICGYRGEQEQNSAYINKFSKLQYPKSKHNKIPSMAVDSVPYPINWQNTNRMRYYAGFVVGIANMLKEQNKITHGIRWGGDWDKDTETNDQRFNDLPHFELTE